MNAELTAALGYMLNAKIDLETGAPKATALATLNGGIKRIRAYLDTAEPVLVAVSEMQPCENCIDGRCYNNADPTSGQWVPCDCPLGEGVF